MRRNRFHKRRTGNYKLLLVIVLFWGLSALTTLVLLNWDQDANGQSLGEEVGKKYLAAAFPVISRSTGTELRATLTDEVGAADAALTETDAGQDSSISGDTETTEAGVATVVDSAGNGTPLVLIYHTHATESYQPVSEGNFHSKGEAGTVREVGNLLETALETKGIQVVHDKTLHDSPSYSKSYSRSIETAQSILDDNPSIRIVIDLHRDAASYSGNQGRTFIVDGKTAAQFCLVVGQGNDNTKELTAFANKVNQKANALYPGFSRGIIEKEYKYNQYIANNYLLLEMGNNENTIEEVKLSADYFAEALAEVIGEM